MSGLMGDLIVELGTSLVVQWLRLHTPNAGATGSIPGWGTKIPQATWQKKKKKIVDLEGHYTE